MREIAEAVIQALHLDYMVTFVSGGASRNYEIVMWDRPHNTYFSIRLTWEPDTPRDTLAGRIEAQLRERLACYESGGREFGERAPTPARVSPHPTGRV